MYSSVKSVAVISVILSLFNAVGAILSLMFIMPDLPFNMIIMIATFLFSTAILFLVLSFFLFSLYGNLSTHEDSNFNDLSSLRKRVDTLEKMLDK